MQKVHNNQLPEDMVLMLLDNMTQALKCLRKVGIIHRDIKTANVMAHKTESGQVFDFIFSHRSYAVFYGPSNLYNVFVY